MVIYNNINHQAYTLINELNNDGIMEAPSVIFFDNKYWLYADAQEHTNPFYVSDDLENWSTLNKLTVEDNINIRHFTPIVIDTTEKKNVIKNFIKNLGVEPIPQKEINMGNIILINEGTVDCLTLMPKAIYRYNATTETIINSIDTSLMKKGDKCYIHPAFSNDTSKLTIAYNANNLIWWNRAKDIVFSKANSNNDIVYEIVCVNDLHYCFFTTKIVENGVTTSTVTLSNGLIVKFYKRNGITTATIVGKPTIAITALTTVSFTSVCPTDYLPSATEMYGGYTLATGNACNMKIYNSGKIEINSSAGVATSQYFECSATYVSAS